MQRTDLNVHIHKVSMDSNRWAEWTISIRFVNKNTFSLEEYNCVGDVANAYRIGPFEI